MMPVKPRYGEPCNGCGICCIAAQCDISTALFGEQERCPALEAAGTSLSCGLVRNTAEYVPDITAWGGKALTEAFYLMLGAGVGCDADDAETTAEHRQAMRPAMLAKAHKAMAKASPAARELLAYFRRAA